ncbi:exosporium glycoprotein BclB-related protein [Lysinibacillus sp. NPDC097231]|uniref:exosporium glycoprotein BclB-related protein n=1 Tax=Lysinibacillus sp. NPDC097231 TaxID=3364142 RepID=UPI00382269A6
MSKCSCQSNFPTRKECENFGPFVAIDINCINLEIENGAENDSGSIIPFASGITTSIVAIASGTTRVASLIGFGTAVNGVSILDDNTINLTSTLSEAFSVPRNGNITSISATFDAFFNPNRGGTQIITAQIFRAEAGTNIFTPTNARVDLAPPITGPSATLTFGTANIEPLPVVAGDRLVMVVYISSSINPPALNFSILGTVSAGINIV